MKFTKFGKAVLMSALSIGAMFSVTSCVRSYTVGFLYVTGTVTAGTSGQGIISGFKIDHNTGRLVRINGLPVSSGGSNPQRAVLVQAGRFLYVLNRGTNSTGGSVCTTADPCSGGNITQFAIGGNGILTPQQTFYSQGINPFRMVTDVSGNFIFVLDHDSPDNSTCALALGDGVASCGDITVFKIDSTTGRLSLVVNAQVTQASGSALPYFPVPANPIDFAITNSAMLTLSGTPTDGDSAFPYTYSSATGQLTINSNSSQPLGVYQATAIVYTATNYMYVLDNEPITYTPTGASSPITVPSQILPFTVGTNGYLQAQTGGAVPNAVGGSNPIFIMSEKKGKWAYLINQGDSSDTTTPQSNIAGYLYDTSTHQLTPLSGSPFGTGSGPQCIVEDPSNQFIYTANFNDSTVTGRTLDQNLGNLNSLSGKANQPYPLDGQPTWCLVSSRTS